MEYKLEGNPCIFGLFIVCNVIFMIIGIGITACGIYLCLEANNVAWYDFTFAILGAAIIIVAIIGHRSRFSEAAINVYIFSILAIFLAQGALTIAIVVLKEFSHEVNKENATATRIFMIVATAIIGVCMIIGFFYRKSLKEANFDHKTMHSLSLTGVHALANPFSDSQKKEIETKFAVYQNK